MPMVDEVEYLTANRDQAAAESDRFTPARYRQFGRHLGRDSGRVLDVGCATGRGGSALKAMLPRLELVGLDCLADRLERLPKDTYSNSVCAFSTSIPEPDASYDIVVAGEFIEHIKYVDVMPTLHEFRRIIRGGGRIIMTTPNPDYIRLRLTGRTMLGGAHVSAHFPKQLGAMLEETGFHGWKTRGSGRVSRLLGERFPLADMYGSYLIWADA